VQRKQPFPNALQRKDKDCAYAVKDIYLSVNLWRVVVEWHDLLPVQLSCCLRYYGEGRGANDVF
jgi:hypothetical protein